MASGDSNLNLLRQRISLMLKALPQYEAVKDRAEDWVSQIIEFDPEHAEFHARCLSGFMPHEIAALVSNKENKPSQSGSARDVVASKLLMTMPEKQSESIHRDTLMEPLHRQLFIEKNSKLGCSVDNELMYKFINAPGPRSWMKYTPDDVLIIANAKGAPRVLIDYCHPEKKPNPEKIGFSYVCQLHQGKMVADHNQLQIDLLWISQFDYEKFVPLVSVIQYDPDLADKILMAGDYYWQEFVLKGELPEHVNPQVIVNDDDHAELKMAATHFGVMHVLAEAAKQKADSFGHEIQTMMEHLELESTEFHAGFGGFVEITPPGSDAVGFHIALASGHNPTLNNLRLNAQQLISQEFKTLVRQIFPALSGETNNSQQIKLVEVLPMKQGTPMLASAMRG